MVILLLWIMVKFFELLKNEVCGSVVMVCLLVLIRLVFFLFLMGKGLIFNMLFFDCSVILMFLGI